MKTILVPVDLSAAASQVCKTACDFAKKTGANLLLMHVVQPPPVVTDLYAMETAYLDNILAAGEKLARRRLLALARLCVKRGVRTRTYLRIGGPVPEILRCARRVTFIVIGSHGHGAMYDLIVGSTTLGVLTRTTCPVVVVPSKPRR